MHIALLLSLTMTFALHNTSLNARASNTIEFDLKRLQGVESGVLQDHRGKVVIVEFWATYCGHCKRTHPLLAKVDKSPDIVSLGISWQRLTRLIKYLSKHDIGFTVLHDPRAKTAQKLRASATPTIYVFDQEGKLRFREVGAPAAPKAVQLARKLAY